MKNVLGTPLRNCSLKNPETLLLEPTKRTFGTHKKQCFGNRCRQPSRKACARCLWRSGSDRLTQRKKSHGGAPSSSPPPFDHNLLQQLPRRAPPHSDEGSADNHIALTTGQNYGKPPLCQVNRGHESRFWRYAHETIN